MGWITPGDAPEGVWGWLNSRDTEITDIYQRVLSVIRLPPITTPTTPDVHSLSPAAGTSPTYSCCQRGSCYINSHGIIPQYLV